MSPNPQRQPIFNIPAVVLGLIAVMAVLQGLRDWLPDSADADVLARFAFVPGRLTYAFDPSAVLAGVRAISLDDDAGRQSFAIARFFLGDGSLQPWTVLTYALLHGGWMHWGLNSVWLLAFGAPLAGRLGMPRFLLFMASGAIAGALAQTLADPLSLMPLVGASAAVSACMGAALRFMFQPDVRPASLEPRAPPGRGPRLPLLAAFQDRRARAFMIVWFLTNIATGFAAIPLGLSQAPIAWQAHIGGFLLGLLAFPLFDRGAPDLATAPAAPSPPDA